MYYAQFFNTRTYPTKTDELLEACGDRAVVIFDGRMTLTSMIKEAERVCEQRKYAGWQMFKGETFTRSNAISKVYRTKGEQQ